MDSASALVYFMTQVDQLSSLMHSFISLISGAKLEDKDTDGFTALHHAASNGHLYVVQLLLDLGANPMATNR